MLFWKLKKKVPVSLDHALAVSVRKYIDKNLRKQLSARSVVYKQTDICMDSLSELQTGMKDTVPGPECKVSLPRSCQEIVADGKTLQAPKAAESSKQVFLEVPEKRKRSLEEIIRNIGEPFQTRLLRLIDERGLTDTQAYKKAGKDKRLFHKIRSNPAYQPSKHTVFAFALGLELSVDETVDLLASAGFAFSPGSRFDLIVRYALEHGIYDLYTVDCILYELGEEEYFYCQK